MRRLALGAALLAALATSAFASASPAAHWVATDIAAQAHLEFPRYTGLALVGMTPAGRVIWTTQRPDGTQWEREVFQWQNGLITDLGPLPQHALPDGLNAGGAIIGTSYEPPYCGYASPPSCHPGPGHAFLWQPGKLTPLGSLGGADSEAWSINDRGQIVGSSQTAGGVRHAFLWQGGTMTDLGTSSGGESDALAINNRGQILEDISVGKSDEIVLWQEGRTTPIASFRNCQWAAFNDRGQVIGLCKKPGGPTRALLWVNGRTTDLGVDFQGAPMAINDRSDVVEPLQTSEDSSRGVLWRNGERIDLGSFGGPRTLPIALNERDQVVGVSSAPVRRHGFVVWHPFFWQGGKLTMLPAAGSVSFDVMDVNAAGTLIAGGMSPFSCGSLSCADTLFVWQYVR